MGNTTRAGDDASPPKNKPSTGNNTDGVAPALIEVNFPERLTPFVWLAMGVGLLLVAVAVMGYVVDWQLEASGSLLLSSGMAIILAAFGGQATVRGKIYVLAGVAALALVLVAFLEQRRSADRDRLIAEQSAKAKQYVRGNIHQVPADAFSLSLKFGRNVLGGTDIYGRQFSFVVFQEEAQEAEIASLTLEPRDEGAPLSIAIPTSCIITGMGAQPLDWEMQEVSDGFEIRDRRRNFQVIGRWGGERAEPCNSAIGAVKTHTGLANVLLGNWQAFAQDEAPLGPAPLPVDLAKIAVDLESDDTEIRRSARDALSLAPAEQIPAILDLVRVDPETYRIKLGVTVALTELLRRDKSKRSSIIPVLTDPDRNLLLDFAADQDRTLRIYATEFLFDLGDPAVTKLAIPKAATTESDDARYNWLLAAQDGWWRLDEASKVGLRPDLNAAYERSGERTRELFEAFKD